jgi:hypothetical protein
MEPHEGHSAYARQCMDCRTTQCSEPTTALLAQLLAAFHFHPRDICPFNEPSECSLLFRHRNDRTEWMSFGQIH